MLTYPLQQQKSSAGNALSTSALYAHSFRDQKEMRALSTSDSLWVCLRMLVSLCSETSYSKVSIIPQDSKKHTSNLIQKNGFVTVLGMKIMIIRKIRYRMKTAENFFGESE